MAEDTPTTPVDTPASAAAKVSGTVGIGPIPGTVPGGDTSGPQTPSTERLQEPLEQPVGGPPVRPGFRDQGLRPPSRPGLRGKIEDTAQYGGGHILGEIFQTLAGGKKKEWVQTENGPVAQYRDLKPGEMARGILAAAITGLASGYDPARRGKGPAMSAAFAGGFEGNQERVDAQKKAAAGEAQKQFENQGVAEERKLRLAENTRRQQESMDRHSEHLQMEQKINQEILNNKTTSLHENIRFNHETQLWWDSYMAQGAQVVPGSPKEGFATDEEAAEWAHNHANVAIGDPRNGAHFNTVFQRKPGTNRTFILEIPEDESKAPRHHGILVDANDNPILGADGQPQADPKNPYYGSDGHTPIVTLKKETDDDFFKHQQSTIDARARYLTAEAAGERAKADLEKAQQDRKNSKDVQVAEDHLTAAYAAGGIDKTDAKGNLIFTPGDRRALQRVARDQHSAHDQMWVNAQKALNEMGPDDPRRPEAQKLVDAEQALVMQSASLDKAMTDIPNAAIAITKDLVAEKTYRTTDGKIDIEKAMANLSPDLPKKIHDDIKDNLEQANKQLSQPKPTVKLKDVPKPNAVAGAVAGALGGGITSGLGGAISGALAGSIGIDETTRKAINKLPTAKERMDYINKLPLSDEGKKQLIQSATVSSEPTKAARTAYVVDPEGQVYPVQDSRVPELLEQGFAMANQQQITAFLPKKTQGNK